MEIDPHNTTEEINTSSSRIKFVLPVIPPLDTATSVPSPTTLVALGILALVLCFCLFTLLLIEMSSYARPSSKDGKPGTPTVNELTGSVHLTDEEKHHKFERFSNSWLEANKGKQGSGADFPVTSPSGGVMDDVDAAATRQASREMNSVLEELPQYSIDEDKRGAVTDDRGTDEAKQGAMLPEGVLIDASQVGEESERKRDSYTGLLSTRSAHSLKGTKRDSMYAGQLSTQRAKNSSSQLDGVTLKTETYANEMVDEQGTLLPKTASKSGKISDCSIKNNTKASTSGIMTKRSTESTQKLLPLTSATKLHHDGSNNQGDLAVSPSTDRVNRRNTEAFSLSISKIPEGDNAASVVNRQRGSASSIQGASSVVGCNGRALNNELYSPMTGALKAEGMPTSTQHNIIQDLTKRHSINEVVTGKLDEDKKEKLNDEPRDSENASIRDRYQQVPVPSVSGIHSNPAVLLPRKGSLTTRSLFYAEINTHSEPSAKTPGDLLLRRQEEVLPPPPPESPSPVIKPKHTEHITITDEKFSNVPSRKTNDEAVVSSGAVLPRKGSITVRKPFLLAPPEKQHMTRECSIPQHQQIAEEITAEVETKNVEKSIRPSDVTGGTWKQQIAYFERANAVLPRTGSLTARYINGTKKKEK
ncbi:hypothetical protein CAPTEDRAFT_205082 [Capitella teleta]|uniref:Uncharacterized protein n=1 Tax=Capitella teleta TaxID=283909 RepID=R7TFL4_CAPTE|nr:hypothetical protein CAPTEDRAFT_205082 [Capitella teleta]|eukprot:ELT90301.1 hypothetical protein CAPTEDRAFT_205082 [Capitella teleta]